MIHAEQLTKWYGPTLAVDDVSFTVEAGSVVGFLGPNGAGKSTTIRMLTGYLPPTSGKATLAGHDLLTDPFAARRRLGYLPESTPLYPEMRVVEYLHFVGRLQGMSRQERRQRIGVVVEECGLEKVVRRTIGRLSKGNRQRCGLASTLLHDPPVLVLDEPTSGLDPRQMSQVRDLVRGMKGRRTVLLSSHLLPEVQRVCDRAVIIANGKVVADGTLDELREQAVQTAPSGGWGPVLVEVRGGVDEVKAVLRGVPAVAEFDAAEADEAGWVDAWLVPEGGADVRADAAAMLSASSLLVREIRREAPTLEEFFIRVTDAGRGDGDRDGGLVPEATSPGEIIAKGGG